MARALAAGWAALGLLAAAGPALAEPARERAQLLARQAELTQAFEQEQAQCRSRFVVTPCLEDVASRRRAALEPIRDRLLQLDERDRRERAGSRQQAVQAKLQERERRERAAAERAQQAASEAAAAGPGKAGVAPRPAAPQAVLRAAAAASQAAEREQAARARAEQARERQAQAQQRQQRVQKRLEERAAEGKPPQPLPTPPR